MGMGFAPTWLRQVSPPPLLHKTTLTTARHYTHTQLLPAARLDSVTWLSRHAITATRHQRQKSARTLEHDDAKLVYMHDSFGHVEPVQPTAE